MTGVLCWIWPERQKNRLFFFKSNISRMAAGIAKSHNGRPFQRRQDCGCCHETGGGIIRVKDIHDMTVCAKALRLPPLAGNRLVAISLSGGFAVILGDACEKAVFYARPCRVTC